MSAASTVRPLLACELGSGTMPFAPGAAAGQFHTDLAEFHPACRGWQEHLPDTPLPVSAIQVPAALAHPACSVQADLWIHAPTAD